jgi:hypothetical protein
VSWNGQRVRCRTRAHGVGGDEEAGDPESFRIDAGEGPVLSCVVPRCGHCTGARCSAPATRDGQLALSNTRQAVASAAVS